MKRDKTRSLILVFLVLLLAASSCHGQETRCDIVTLDKVPLTLVGPELKEGDMAPAFSLLDFRSRTETLKDFSGKAKIISVVPSVDTPT